MHCALVQEIARSFMQQTILARSFMQPTILARRFMQHQLWQWDLANLETGTYITVLVHVGLVAVSLKCEWVGGCVCKFFSCLI
jgi:hypothetical protein